MAICKFPHGSHQSNGFVAALDQSLHMNYVMQNLAGGNRGVTNNLTGLVGQEYTMPWSSPPVLILFIYMRTQHQIII